MNYKNIEEGNVLQAFKSTVNSSFFQDVQGQLPQFLSENLLDPQRIIKHFYNDLQAPIRIFYYQYLKICFQMQNTDYESYIAKLQELLQDQSFKIKFPQNKDRKIYNNKNAKKLIEQFIQYIDKQQVTIQQGLSQFPIMDQIFVSLIRSLLISNNVCQKFDEIVPREILFEFLASYFCLDIALYQNCLKFIDSDVFMYQQDPKNIYMIYIDYLKQNENDCQVIHEQTDSEASSAQQIISKINLSEDKEATEQGQINSGIKSSGIFQFVDYTLVKPSLNKQNTQETVCSQYSSKQKKSFISSSGLYTPANVIQQVSEEVATTSPFHNSLNYNQYGLKNPKKQEFERSFVKIKKQNFENTLKDIGKQAISQYMPTPSSTYDHRVFGKPILQNDQSFDKSIDYKGKIGPFNYPKRVSTYAQAITSQYQYNYLKNLSNQFTNSLLLKQIRDPFRESIKMMKIRARAQRNVLFNQ